jgi:hypothetical protein
VGTQFGFVLALIAPFLQIVVAGCLLARMCLSTAFGLAAFLLGEYSIAQAAALWRGLNVACGCSGAIDSSPVTLQAVSFVTTLCMCSVAASYLTRAET